VAERDIEGQVLAAVEATGAPHRRLTIDPSLADTADFCSAYGFPLEASANCILVASRDDPPVVAACLVLATTRLDVNQRVRRLLGVRKLSFAPADLTREVTGMEIGGVTPFGLPDRVQQRWADARIAQLDDVVVGGGSRSMKLVVGPAALARVGFEFVEDLALS
jgi:prolyl-tRNA editing enzyme YbaK/EbsC (Cys-tRNA(Pro) deacylase)